LIRRVEARALEATHLNEHDCDKNILKNDQAPRQIGESSSKSQSGIPFAGVPLPNNARGISALVKRVCTLSWRYTHHRVASGVNLRDPLVPHSERRDCCPARNCA
jgi:hypothetical protein